MIYQTITLLDPSVCLTSNPCVNGRCQSSPLSTLGYTCKCSEGYTGKYCEIGSLLLKLFYYIKYR